MLIEYSLLSGCIILADGHVAVNLEGIEYPETWQRQVTDFQVFDVAKGKLSHGLGHYRNLDAVCDLSNINHAGTEEWINVETHFRNTMGGAQGTVTCIQRNQNK